MNFKTTIVLIVLLAAAGVTLFFTREPSAKTDTSSSTEGAKLVELDAKDVNKIIVTPSDSPGYTLEKVGADWQITAPVKAPAETWQVDALLRAVTDAHTRGQVDVGGANAASTGLATPRYQVQLVSPNKTVKLAVGSPSAIGGNLYVQLDGKSQADMIPTDLSDKLDKGIDDLRKKTLVTASSTDIKQITITRSDGRLTLQKNGATWQIIEPTPMPADDTAVSDITFGITGLRADSFVDPKTISASAMAKPQLTVAFTTAAPVVPPATAPSTAPAWTTVQFGAYEDILKKNVYVSVGDTMAKVPASSMDAFKKKALELRDKKVTDLDPEQVSKLVLLTDLPSTTRPTTKPAVNKTIILERRKANPVLGPTPPATQLATTQPTTGPTTLASSQPATAPAAPVLSKWTVTSDPHGDADDSKVSTLLSALHPLRADKYFETAPTTQPAGRYVLSITTTGPGGSPVTEHQMTLVDPGHDQALNGSYNGLNFETPRSILSNLEGEWLKK
jgi:hypothetical protein